MGHYGETTMSVREIADVLRRYGGPCHGGSPEDYAGDWDDLGMSAEDVEEWCAVGCWDAATAVRLRDAGLTPRRARDACDRLARADRAAYTDGDPMYAACNRDVRVDEIVDAAEAE